MSAPGLPGSLPPNLLKRFIHAAHDEVGKDKLLSVLSATGLSPDILEADGQNALGEEGSIKLFVDLQAALRQFYGRGARGILLRIGRNTWEQVVAGATFLEKAELEILRRLPIPARRRRVLTFTAGLLSSGAGSTTVHLLDTEFLLVDRNSASARGQASEVPICFVTVGFLEAALFWATGKDADVEEVTCRASGGNACEFRIRSVLR